MTATNGVALEVGVGFIRDSYESKHKWTRLPRLPVTVDDDG